MHGFINVCKPQGVTSFDVIRIIKPHLPRKHKIGHLGTLDPMASGVLPLALGQANRLIHYIDDHRKEYTATMTLGAVSDTQDAWGEVERTGRTDFSENELNQVVRSFVGCIQQVPPMYSALHHQGKRLYELARQGISVERPSREVSIYEIEILNIDQTQSLPQVVLKVECSKGTYIRTLCYDIGEMLGTGALMSELLRTRSGPFVLEQSVALDQLRSGQRDLQTALLPLDFPLGNYPPLVLAQGSEEYWKHGRRIEVNAELPERQVKVYASSGAFMGMGLIAAEAESDNTELRPLRVII